MAETAARPNRRGVLRSAGAVVGGGLAAMLLRPDRAEAETTEEGPLRVRRRFVLIDAARRQRLRISSVKPPIFHDGTTYPPSLRQGPDDATWVTFNDENQDEKGGMTIATNGESLSFDWANAQAVTLSTGYEGNVGVAQLSMNQQPDPSLPITGIPPEQNPERVLLYTDNAGNGALLWLCDSAGRPRISLQVDGNDVPSIKVLGADGSVIAQLPDQAAPTRLRTASVRGLVDRFRLR